TGSARGIVEEPLDEECERSPARSAADAGVGGDAGAGVGAGGLQQHFRRRRQGQPEDLRDRGRQPGCREEPDAVEGRLAEPRVATSRYPSAQMPLRWVRALRSALT